MAYKNIFGPVTSRRLGVSLGVDLVPSKICTLNCIYCEAGVSTKMTVVRDEYVAKSEILHQLRDYLSHHQDPDYITLSGYGEPTLNSKMGDIIRAIKRMRPNVKVAVITNGTLLYLESVREELKAADLVMPSLDAASLEQFHEINKPHHQLKLDQYINGLIQFSQEYTGQIWLEVLFLKNYNDSPAEVQKLKKWLNQIWVDKIQLNTLDRPGVLKNLESVSREFLEDVQSLWADLPVEIISKVEPSSIPEEIGASFGCTTEEFKENYPQILMNTHEVADQIYQLISRRPCTCKDLQSALGLSAAELKPILKNLERNFPLVKSKQNRGVFYSVTKRETIF